MKAVIHSQYGNPEVLEVKTLERPVSQKYEVLIRVKAAGLDYGQWHLTAGKPYAVRLATGLTKPKKRVLGMAVIGAGGGVGSWAVQLARHFGAHVTAVCSTSKVGFVRPLGATSVIDYTKVPLPTDGRFDVIRDLAGNRPLSILRKALAPRGTLVLGDGEGGDRFFGGMGRMLRAGLWSMFLK